MGLDVPELDLPPIDGGEHIIGHLFDLGPATGDDRLSLREIQAWMDLTGRVLTAWEVDVLHRLSGAYLSEYLAASSPERPPPRRER